MSEGAIARSSVISRQKGNFSFDSDMLGLRRRQASAELPLSSLYELLDEGLEEVVQFCLLMQVKARFKNVRRFPRPDVR